VKRELSPSEPEAVATGQRLNLHDSNYRRLVAKVKILGGHSADRYRSRFWISSTVLRVYPRPKFSFIREQG
jgi:hypothetical protein